MMIKEIYIDGFGIFCNDSFINLKSGINIIEGENEAGKSTFLNFIRYTLFGYPTRNADKCEPLNGGRHGGRILAQLVSGKEVTFERYAGSKGGKIQLHFDNKVSDSEEEWYSFLGNANPQLFRNVYGFTLYELAALEQLGESGIGDKIFSIGIGLGNVSIGQVEESIKNKIEGIYQKRGSAQTIPKILKEIEFKKEAIREIQQGLQRYEEVVKRIAELKADINSLDGKIAINVNRKEVLGNYLKCYENYISILQVDRELKELPNTQETPLNGEQVLKELELQESSLNDAIDCLTSNKESDGIEEMVAQIKDITINENALEVGKSISYLNDHLEKYKQTIEDAATANKQLGELNLAISDSLKAINANWSEETILNFSGIIEHKDAIARFGNEIERLEDKRKNLLGKQEAKQEAFKNTKPVNFYLLAIISFILAFPAFYYSVPFGSAFIVIGIIILLYKKFGIQTNTDNTEIELNELQLEINTCQTSYKNYLRNQLTLTDTLSFKAVNETFILIEQIKKDLVRRDNIKLKEDQERNPYIEKFENAAKNLNQKNIIKTELISYEQFTKDLVQELNNSKKGVEEKNKIESLLESKRRELAKTKESVDKVTENINKLLLDSNCSDRAIFKDKCVRENSTRVLVENKKNLINVIEQIIGFGKVEELFLFFKTTVKQDLENEILILQNSISEQQDNWGSMREETGALQTEQASLKSHSTLAEIETKIEVEKEKLFNSYKEWLSNKVALKILSDIKEKYEIEKQPEVIKYSSDVFNQITSDKYKRINVSLDNREVLVFDKSEKLKKINQLSRGTKEQLLISLRLGLIQEYEKHNESLPIVLDDVFVNFDPDRIKSIASTLEKFAENRQIIIFTCHPLLASYFSGSVNKISLLST